VLHLEHKINLELSNNLHETFIVTSLKVIRGLKNLKNDKYLPVKNPAKCFILANKMVVIKGIKMN
jgi:hypothetical protein